MTWFPKNTSLEDRVEFYMTTVGLSQQETQAYLTPVSQYDKNIFSFAMSADKKVCDWISSYNEQHKKDNPWKYAFTFSQEAEYEEKEEDTETTMSISNYVREHAIPSKNCA